MASKNCRPQPSTFMVPQDLPMLPPREPTAHKGTFGHALLIGGATGMTGAIAIAGMACLRTGAGLVTLAVPQNSHAIVASLDPNYMTVPLPCDASGRLISVAKSVLSGHLERASCIAIGPGLGRSEASDEIVTDLFENFQGPMILDADGLNALSESDIWTQMSRRETRPNNALRILTPHPGEWERLSGVAAKDRAGQMESANKIASRTHFIILLKGNQTFITNGKESFINSTGNASMAVGGSGDCLTGIIAALVCQRMECINAVRLGAYLHGLSGDLAHDELGTPSTLAVDLIQFLPAAFRVLAKKNLL